MGNFYVIDNKIYETRCGQKVYGTILVEGIVKERLEALIDVKKKLTTAEADLATKDKKLERKERDLEKVRSELEEAEEVIRGKDNTLGGMRTTLVEKETALNQALGKVKDCEAKFGRQMFEKASMMAEMKTTMETKIQAAEDRAKKLEEELGIFKQNENDKVAKTEEMAQKIKEAAKEIEGLQEALSTANDKLEDAAVMTDFWRQESIKNEHLLADQKTSFIEYKTKMEQKMAETTKLYQDQMADQKKAFLEKQDKMQQDMEKLAKHYKKKMVVQEKGFLEQKDSLQKKVEDMEKHFEDQMAAVSATNADLKRQNEIFIMTIANLSETASSMKVKDSEKTMMRNEKKEGRMVIEGS